MILSCVTSAIIQVVRGQRPASPGANPYGQSSYGGLSAPMPPRKSEHVSLLPSADTWAAVRRNLRVELAFP